MMPAEILEGKFVNNPNDSDLRGQLILGKLLGTSFQISTLEHRENRPLQRSFEDDAHKIFNKIGRRHIKMDYSNYNGHTRGCAKQRLHNINNAPRGSKKVKTYSKPGTDIHNCR